jgi:hypothetical protein
MDDNAVLIMLGNLQGEMKGIGREIGDIKTLLNNDNQSCQNCKQELNGRIGNLELHGAGISQKNAQDIIKFDERLLVVEDHCKDETAVQGFTDRIEYRWFLYISSITGIILTLFEIVKFLKTGSL